MAACCVILYFVCAHLDDVCRLNLTWLLSCCVCRSTLKFICAARSSECSRVRTHAHTHRYIVLIHQIHRVRCTPHTRSTHTTRTYAIYRNETPKQSNTLIFYYKISHTAHYARDSLPKINIKATMCGVFVGFCQFLYFSYRLLVSPRFFRIELLFV